MRDLRVCLLAAALAVAAPAAATASQQPWIAAWAASPVAADPDPDEPLTKLQGQTVRERARLSIGADKIRVRLSNQYGSAPLTIGAATAALAVDANDIEPETLRTLSFAGKPSVTIPAGASVLSDPADLVVAPNGEISLSLYIPDKVATATIHALAMKRTVIAAGDVTHAAHVDMAAKSGSSLLLTQVLAERRPGQRLVAALGDSTTDGDGATFGADKTWPADLARRAAESDKTLAVVNEGVAGNRLLADGPFASLGVAGVTRFAPDVLTLPGLTHVIVFEGVNDIGFPGASRDGFNLGDPAKAPTADDIIAGYRRLIAMAHARGVKVLGATITPSEGVDMPGYFTPAKDREREAVNHWIRTAGAFDGVIDFDAVVRDPAHPSRLNPAYASADHLHPNDAGYQAMADAIDLKLLR
jgi:lysophospholipase L1-like esterase